MQIKTSSNWYSCFSYSTQTGVNNIVIPVVSTCQTANNLAFCTMLNNNKVMVNGSRALSVQDALTQSYFTSLINNPLVFATGKVNF